MAKDKLLGIKEDFNSFAETNINFKVTQCMRLFFMILLLLCFLVSLYILVKMAFFYVNCWAMVLSLVSVLYVGFSAGRMVVEEKMLEKRRTAEKDTPADKIKLDSKDRSKLWKQAFKLYAVAFPLAVIVPILFNYTSMGRDVICQLASYAPSDKQA